MFNTCFHGYELRNQLGALVPHSSVLAQIKDGQVCLGYDLGHGNTSGCVPFSINDGNWHKVGPATHSAMVGRDIGRGATEFSLFIGRYE